jgi:tetratricopeptide (TPR) repeat protein
MLRGSRAWAAAGWLPAVLAIACPVWAAEPCDPVIGRVASSEGQVEVQRARAGSWQPIVLDEAVCQGDTIRVARRSRAAVVLVNDAILRIDENTTLRLLNINAAERERSFLDLVAGKFQTFIRRPRSLAVNTPYLNGSIEGTEFLSQADASGAGFIILEGRVLGANNLGSATAQAGESVTAAPGAAPRSAIVVRPRDAVQWALYYPPVLVYPGGPAASGPAAAPLRQAVELAGRRDMSGAFAALDRVPPANQNAEFHTVRASLLLSVGRVGEARSDIDRALALSPKSGDAYALRSVIGVAQNETQQALADGSRAVAASPRATSAKIALSYAQQANFQLEAARDTLLQAVAEQPNDALALSRLAELWLALGHRDRAVETAQEAVSVAPDLERAQVVLGFAALSEFRTMSAARAFTRATQLDSADPLPRLGLGLARIRDGDVADGRKEIETAVGLDSGNALLRAYLGKAYFEEKRGPLDADQFAISKNLDPKDPTPFLYDAIRKQTENRPGEALADIEASVDRNDNRAVYRGRQQLDQDRAARGTSLGRVYEDLGFHQLGVNESTKSLALDPANASAHRFLSDTLRGVRRTETARVSELLQAQLLQDININPVQPSLSETNLNIAAGGGPAQAGFNEFTPLFERNRAQLNVTGLAGNHRTFGDEIVASGLWDRFSLSAGQFHYQTDVFRENNNLRHDIYDVFAQAALTPEINVQGEFRRRETTEGDLFLNFDPNQFSPNRRQETDQNIARVGGRWSPSPSHDLLLSYIHKNQNRTLTDSSPSTLVDPVFGPLATGTLDSSTAGNANGDQYEAQYIFRRSRFNAVTGLFYANVDGEAAGDTAFNGTLDPLFGGGPFNLAFPATTTSLDVVHRHGYLYTNVNYPMPVTWTFGMSGDEFEEEGFSLERLNGKFGVQVDVTRDIRLRGAAFSTVKPALTSNQTLEPTQVAGFNQLFDDIDGTKSTRYGIGADWRVLRSFNVGAEATWRYYEEPVNNATTGLLELEDRREQLHRAYATWAVTPEVALIGELVYDRYWSEPGLDVNRPETVNTFSVPLGVRYFHHSGFFAGAGASFVHQTVHRFAGSTLAQGTDDFTVVDAGVGYRFPRRRGVASLGVRNLFNNGFKYQDDNYREFSDQPHVGPYIPDRSIVGRVTLSLP